MTLKILVITSGNKNMFEFGLLLPPLKYRLLLWRYWLVWTAYLLVPNQSSLLLILSVPYLSVCYLFIIFLLLLNLERVWEKGSWNGGRKFCCPGTMCNWFPCWDIVRYDHSFSFQNRFTSVWELSYWLHLFTFGWNTFHISVTSLPASSYRLGVKASRLHDLFPAHITKALQCSIEMFDKEVPKT